MAKQQQYYVLDDRNRIVETHPTRAAAHRAGKSARSAGRSVSVFSESNYKKHVAPTGSVAGAKSAGSLLAEARRAAPSSSGAAEGSPATRLVNARDKLTQLHNETTTHAVRMAASGASNDDIKNYRESQDVKIRAAADAVMEHATRSMSAESDEAKTKRAIENHTATQRADESSARALKGGSHTDAAKLHSEAVSRFPKGSISGKLSGDKSAVAQLDESYKQETGKMVSRNEKLSQHYEKLGNHKQAAMYMKEAHVESQRTYGDAESHADKAVRHSEQAKHHRAAAKTARAAGDREGAAMHATIAKSHGAASKASKWAAAAEKGATINIMIGPKGGRFVMTKTGGKDYVGGGAAKPAKGK